MWNTSVLLYYLLGSFHYLPSHSTFSKWVWIPILLCYLLNNTYWKCYYLFLLHFLLYLYFFKVMFKNIVIIFLPRGLLLVPRVHRSI